MTVVGTPESQWKAQYLIFEKLREEGFAAGQDDVRLTVEILVPAAQVDSRHIQTPQVHMYIQTSVTGGKNHWEGRTKCERNAATDWSRNKTTGTGKEDYKMVKIQGVPNKVVRMARPVSYTHLTLPTNREV